MRITLNIRDNVLAAARKHADAHGISIGAALSDLAERGLAHELVVVEEDGFWKGVKFLPVPPNDPSQTSAERGGASDKVTESISPLDLAGRTEELYDCYDALRGNFPDDEFHDAWDPIVEPLLWALPEERDPALLEHVDRLAPSSPLWSMVQRMLGYRATSDPGHGEE